MYIYFIGAMDNCLLVVVAQQHIGISERQAHIYSIIGVQVQDSPQQLGTVLRGTHVLHHVVPPHQTLVGVLVCTLHQLVCGLGQTLTHFGIILLSEQKLGIKQMRGALLRNGLHTFGCCPNLVQTVESPKGLSGKVWPREVPRGLFQGTQPQGKVVLPCLQIFQTNP